jgi:hypothetical protein
MYHNPAHPAITFENGVIKINLDVLNCSKIELVKNRQLQVIHYENGDGQNSVILTLEQLNWAFAHFSR